MSCGALDRRAMVVLLVLAVVVATSAAVCQVWTRLKVIEYGYKISKAARMRQDLIEANRRLRLEIAFLTNPGRVARVATEEMGLHPLLPEQVRRLRRPGFSSRSAPLSRTPGPGRRADEHVR